MKNGRRNGGSAINRRDLPESRSQFQFSRPSHLHRRTFIVCHRRYHVGAALRFLVIFASRSNEAGAGVSASNLVSARSTEVKLAAIGDPECPRFTTFRFLFSPSPPLPISREESSVRGNFEGELPRTIYQFTMIKSKHGK